MSGKENARMNRRPSLRGRRRRFRAPCANRKKNVMKQALMFLLYGVVFFGIVFGILYAGEAWLFPRGKSLASMGIEAGVAAAVFAVFLLMVVDRGERDELKREEKRERKAWERKNANR